MRVCLLKQTNSKEYKPNEPQAVADTQHKTISCFKYTDYYNRPEHDQLKTSSGKRPFKKEIKEGKSILKVLTLFPLLAKGVLIELLLLVS